MRATFGEDAEGMFVALSTAGKPLHIERGAAMADALSLFDRALRAERRKADDVTEILVDRGPGGFSTVRRRVAVASALASSLGAKLAGTGPTTPERAARLPASAFRKSASVAPRYDRPPNITMGKPRGLGRKGDARV